MTDFTGPCGGCATGVHLYGESHGGKLLILSQAVLGFQRPFAAIPLVMFTASKSKTGDLVAPPWLTAAAGVIAAVTVTPNVKLLVDVFSGA